MGRTHLRALAGSDRVAVVAVAEPVDALRGEAASADPACAYARSATCSTRAASTGC